MRQSKSLAALQARFLITGTAAQAKLCIWAEGFAIQTLANAFSIAVLIYDEAVKSNKFVAIKPDDGIVERYVMVQRTRREHYNLIVGEGGRKVFEASQLEERVRELWGIDAGDVSRDAAPATKRRKPIHHFSL